MVKKIVKYVDFNGNECEEEILFNLTKAELAKLEYEVDGGLSNHIKEVVESGNNAELLKLFNMIILESYGVKSEDGKRFIKNEKLKEEFAQSAAFSEIFVEIGTQEGAAEAFVKGLTN